MPEGEYYSDRYRELNTQLAKRERSSKRKSRESLAARGALHSGMTNTTERDIEGQIGDQFTQGARDIEDRRWRAEQDTIARAHQTSERIGSQEYGTSERIGTQLFATNERLGTQDWQSGENEATRGIQLELQKMADAARFELQELVQTGQMDLQEAEQKWASFESDLNRQLDWATTEGQWDVDQAMQNAGIIAAMDLQNDTQEFENFMAELGREWDVADRGWEAQMWLLDAQLQATVAGWDWPDGFEPQWLFGEVGDKPFHDWSIYGGGRTYGGGWNPETGEYVEGPDYSDYDHSNIPAGGEDDPYNNESSGGISYTEESEDGSPTRHYNVAGQYIGTW